MQADVSIKNRVLGEDRETHLQFYHLEFLSLWLIVEAGN